MTRSLRPWTSSTAVAATWSKMSGIGNGSTADRSSVVSIQAIVRRWTVISATDHLAVTRTCPSGTDDTSAANRSQVVRSDSRTAFHWAGVTDAFTFHLPRLAG